VHPGQADRQLDLHEGGRRGVPRAGPAVPQVRRGRRRHGLRRAGAGRQPGGAARSAPRPTGSSSTRSASRPRTSSSTRMSSRWPPASRSTRPTGSTSSRRPVDQGEPARRPGVRRRLQRVLQLPRQQPGPRGDPRGVPLPRHRAGMDMGIVNAGALVVYDEIDPSCASGSRTSCSTAARRHRAAARDRRALQRGRRPGGRGGRSTQWRSLPVRERITHALVKGIDEHVEADTEDCGSSSPPAGPTDRGHRRPAHGRHERRRRPLRRRQDVPPAGREVGAGDEEGGRPPRPVHRGERRRRNADDRMPHTNGTIVMATVKGDVHDIGKNIVGVVLQCNNYEVIDLGVMVPGPEDPRRRPEHGADIIGLSGLITPSLDEMVSFAAEMQRQGFEMPLLIGGATTSKAHTAVKVDAALRRAGGLGQGRLPFGAGGSRAALRRAAPGLLAVVKRRLRRDPGPARRQGRRAAAGLAGAARANRPRSTGRHTSRCGPTCCCSKRRDVTGAEREAQGRATQFTRPSTTTPWPSCALHRLAAVLRRLGAQGSLPRRAQQPRQSGEAARKLYADAQDDARPDRSPSVAAAGGRDRDVPRELGGRRHRGVCRGVPRPGAHHPARLRQQGAAPRRGAEPVPRPTSSPRRRPASATMSAPSP
jgi:methylmalonyl-CoA mutase cobalamin-binding subunit